MQVSPDGLVLGQLLSCPGAFSRHRRASPADRAAVAGRRAGDAPAVAALRRTVGCRKASHRACRGTGDQLPRAPRASAELLDATRAASARPAGALSAACIPDVIVLEPGDMGSIKIEQVRDVIDRAGYPSVRGTAACGDHRRGRRVGAAGAERAAQDARGAAVGVDLLARVVDARRAAAHGAVALSAAALRGAVAGGRGSSAHARPRVLGGRCARRGCRCRRQRRARRSVRSPPISSTRERRLQRLLEQTARARDPGRRLDAARDLSGTQGSPGGERDQLAACSAGAGIAAAGRGRAGGGGDQRVLANARSRRSRSRRWRPPSTASARPAPMARWTSACALERNASPKIVADWLVLQL